MTDALTVKLVADDTDATVTVPGPALGLHVDILAQIANGNAVTVGRDRRGGNRRRVLLTDLITYKRIDDEFATYPVDVAKCRVHEGPAQLGDVLRTATGAQLLPVDQAHASLVDDNVARLQVIVDKALVIGRQISRCVMEMPNRMGQFVEQRRLTPPVIEHPTGEPAQDLVVLR